MIFRKYINMSLYQSPFTTQLCFNKKRYISINNSNYKKSINNSNYKKSINNSNYKKSINNSNYKKSINNSNYKKIINYISFSLSILIVSTILTMPLSVMASIPSKALPNIFPSQIYRNSEHVHSIDEASMSNHYYPPNVDGYDTLYWAYQTQDLGLGSGLKDPSFESSIPSSSWAKVQSGSTFVSGFPVVESSSLQHIDGSKSLHLKSKSTGSSFSYGGVTQSYTHPIALASNSSTMSYKIFPVTLSSTTNGPDSEIWIRFRLLNWEDPSLYPTIIFVYKDTPSNPGNSVGFTNNTNNVYLIRQANFNQWNTVTENLTKIAQQTFGLRAEYGQNFTLDQAVKAIDFRVYSRNNAEAEVFFDAYSKGKCPIPAPTTPPPTCSNAGVYTTQANQLRIWNTSSFQLVPGVELTGTTNVFGLNVTANKFFDSASGSNGPRNDINTLHTKGLYAGIAHPFQTSSQSSNAISKNYPVDMIDIYGNVISDTSTSYATDTKVWDDYLNKTIIAMATATPNVHAPSGASRMNTDAYAIYTFADESATASNQLENMAMGRSFIETVSVGGDSTSTTPMALYFAAENNSVPMGRYPIIVDPSTADAHLNVTLTNLPSSPPNLNLVIKRDGNAIDTTPLPAAGATKYEKGFTFPLPPLPDNYTYFRYEIQDASSGIPLTFSQPLIFVKKSSSIFPGFWTALVPKNSAALDLPVSDVTFTNNVLTEKVKVREVAAPGNNPTIIKLPQGDGKIATVKIFIPVGMFNNDPVSNPPGTFDSTSRILTVNTPVSIANPTTITVSSSQQFLSTQEVIEDSPSLQASPIPSLRAFPIPSLQELPLLPSTK